MDLNRAYYKCTNAVKFIAKNLRYWISNLRTAIEWAWIISSDTGKQKTSSDSKWGTWYWKYAKPMLNPTARLTITMSSSKEHYTALRWCPAQEYDHAKTRVAWIPLFHCLGQICGLENTGWYNNIFRSLFGAPRKSLTAHVISNKPIYLLKIPRVIQSLASSLLHLQNSLADLSQVLWRQWLVRQPVPQC